MNDKGDDFFSQNGLSVQASDNIELGKAYPVYGMITSIVSESATELVVMVNYNLQIKLTIGSADKVQIVKERAFEPGIFVTTFESTCEPTKENPTAYIGSAATVVFGKKQNNYA